MPQEFAGSYSLQRRLAEGPGWDLSVATSASGQSVWVKRPQRASRPEEPEDGFHPAVPGAAPLHPLAIHPVETGQHRQGMFWVYALPAEARSLAEFIEAGHRLDPRAACRWVVAAAEVVKTLAMAQAEIHGHLHPASVVVEETGHAIAVIVDRLPGPLRFQAPEQLKGALADMRSDIFTLGALLYEATTAAHPYGYAGGDDGEPASLLETPTPSPSSLDAEFPRDIEQVVMTAITRDPWVRYQRLSDFIRDLKACSAMADGRQEVPSDPIALPEDGKPAARIPEAQSQETAPRASPSVGSTGGELQAQGPVPTKRQEWRDDRHVLSFSRPSNDASRRRSRTAVATGAALATVVFLMAIAWMGRAEEHTSTSFQGANPDSDLKAMPSIEVRQGNQAAKDIVSEPNVISLRPRAVSDLVLPTASGRPGASFVSPDTVDVTFSAPDARSDSTERPRGPSKPTNTLNTGPGTLTITANVRGARVLANGLPIGRTPIGGVTLDAGIYEVELVAGAVRWSARAAVKSGQESRIYATLQAARVIVTSSEEQGVIICTLDGTSIAVRSRAPIFIQPGWRTVRCEGGDGKLLLERRFESKPGRVHRFEIDAPKPD